MSRLNGKRALVTGASSGIGAEIARQLARMGVHLVLTARRRDALDAVAAACREHGVRVDIVTADLGRPDAARQVWTAALAGGAVDICVNNAGFGYFRPFAAIEVARDVEMIQLNITSLVELSKLFVQAHAQRTERAYLLNVGSIAAYQSTPNFAVYAATKAFVRNFTEALAFEHRNTALSITCLSPGSTSTEFHAQAGAGNYGKLAQASTMSAEECARQGIRAMVKGKRNVITGLINKISCFGVRFVPRRFATWMSTRVLGRPRTHELPSRSTAGAA